MYWALFWMGEVSRCRWDIILGGWGWVPKHFGWVMVGGSGGGELGSVHCLIMPKLNSCSFNCNYKKFHVK